jgi:hypothetical protein
MTKTFLNFFLTLQFGNYVVDVSERILLKLDENIYRGDVVVELSLPGRHSTIDIPGIGGCGAPLRRVAKMEGWRRAGVPKRQHAGRKQILNFLCVSCLSPDAIASVFTPYNGDFRSFVGIRLLCNSFSFLHPSVYDCLTVSRGTHLA